MKEIASTSIILEKRVSNKEGKHPAKLRVTYRRKSKYFTIKNHKYLPEEFEAVINTKSRGENKAIRKELEVVENRAIQIIEELGDNFSFIEFLEKFTNKNSLKKDIWTYFNIKIDELKKQERFSTESLYTATKLSLGRFDNNLSFDKIEPKYLKKYEDWMINNNSSYTTVGMYMRNLRHIINLAIENKALKTYPFGSSRGKYKIPKSTSKKRALDLKYIKMLMEYKPKNKKEKEALSYWLFSYYSNGMNITDIARLKYKNFDGGEFSFIRKKTKGYVTDKRAISVIIIDQIKDIIDDIGNKEKDDYCFVFPILDNDMDEFIRYKTIRYFTKTINDYIKIICSNLKFPKSISSNISTYWARHTFATVLLRSGESTEMIGESLGHTKMETTKNYLSGFDIDARKNAMKALIPKDI